MKQRSKVMVAEHPSYALSEYCECWENQSGVRLSESAICRFLQKQNLTIKKTLGSSQAGTEVVQPKRLGYWQAVGEVAVENLVFLDEMGVLLGLMRGYGRSPKGERLYDVKPFYRGSRVSVVGAITQISILAIKVVGQSTNGETFKSFLQDDLAPKLWNGAVVVMDNLTAHKVKGVAEILASVGARVLYSAPYSSEFNPIEHLWWSLKVFLRRFAPKSREGVEKLLNIAVLVCSGPHLRNYFAHRCYCTN